MSVLGSYTTDPDNRMSLDEEDKDPNKIVEEELKEDDSEDDEDRDDVGELPPSED